MSLEVKTNKTTTTTTLTTTTLANRTCQVDKLIYREIRNTIEN